MHISRKRDRDARKSDPNCPGQQEICSAMEPCLQPCVCGGSFKRGSAPRCPHCNQSLSSEVATDYIERNAPGTEKGWRWQKNWSGVYCIVIEDNRVGNNFRSLSREQEPLCVCWPSSAHHKFHERFIVQIVVRRGSGEERLERGPTTETLRSSGILISSRLDLAVTPKLRLSTIGPVFGIRQ
jgi:hypothetical protein